MTVQITKNAKYIGGGIENMIEGMVKDYNDCKSQNYEEIKTGDIIWQVQNLHVYERHFHLVE